MVVMTLLTVFVVVVVIDVLGGLSVSGSGGGFFTGCAVGPESRC
jgi:hypothetical protein